MNVEYSLSEAPFSDAQIAELSRLALEVFPTLDEADSAWRLAHLPDVSCFEARQGDRLVGFKTGYAVTSKRFYSWLGGVHPDFRRRGIAGELMRRQHLWLSERGYQEVETRVDASNEVMAWLNMAVGYSAIGAIDVDGEARLICRKRLAGGDPA
jgi:ribosomal protein S18 acetylase RimI-like enzyme